MAKRKPAESPSTIGSFEDSLTELQAIVADLEDGSLGLESSLARFERGVGLLHACYVILDSAEQKIEVLTQREATAPSEGTSKLTVAVGDDPEQSLAMRDERIDELVKSSVSVGENEKSVMDEPSLF